MNHGITGTQPISSSRSFGNGKTSNHSWGKTIHYAYMAFLACLLGGCMGGGGNSVRYYLIDPVSVTESTASPSGTLSIEITDLHIPQYLERFQIVTRDTDNRLLLSESNQWGENLRKNLMRTLSQNLAGRMATIDIGTPLNPSASPPDYRIQVYISKFERDTDGIVKLSARWQISNGSDQVLGTYSNDLDSGTRIDKEDFGAIVAAMQDLYGQLSAKIADSIIAAGS